VGIVPWHQVGSVEGLAEFVDSFVHGSSRFADIHEEVFADRFYPVEAGFPRDLPEFFFVSGERDPRGPREGGPGVREEVTVWWISMRGVGIGRHL
jgi:ferritin-like protein